MRLFGTAGRLALAAVLCTVAPALADPWGSLVLVNRGDTTIVGLRVKPEDQWSGNLLAGARLEPGASADLSFRGRDGPCEVPIQVLSEDGSVLDAYGRFCDVRYLYIDSFGATWE